MAESNATAPTAVVLIIADREPASLNGFAALAAHGARFTRAYSADPASGRGREAILRGRFPHADAQGKDVAVLLGTAGWKIAGAAGEQTDRYCAVLQPPAGGGVACLRDTLARLTRAGTLADTLLVLTATRASDEETWFDKSTHVPLLIQWPRRIAAAEFDALASGVDIAPTVLALCGVARPDEMQGRDLSALLLGSGGDRPESIYAEGRVGTADSWRMMVRGLDKLVFTPDLRILHLYNLGQDPEETTDLAREVSEERKCDELRAIAADWRRRLSDEMDPSGLKRR
jgi:arylsulfatase A-like enzyme